MYVTYNVASRASGNVRPRHVHNELYSYIQVTSYMYMHVYVHVHVHVVSTYLHAQVLYQQPSTNVQLFHDSNVEIARCLRFLFTIKINASQLCSILVMWIPEY